jgi:prolyl-tRNA synthetase
VSGVLTSQAADFPRWYQEVLAKATLAETGPVRGTMVIRPYGYAIWERIQAEMDRRIKAAGAENVYFPLLIPESRLRREAEHVEGFSPELAVVTEAGGRRLEEPVVIRPTSETVFGEYTARWVQSHRDLPLRLNQWANVVRWELRPRLFLRTSEFLWQEGHTAHASRADAATDARRIHADVYRAVLEDVLAIPVLTGLKTDAERFAGATATLTCEGMMRDGKALQLATSHELGQNFARAFDITYTDAQGSAQICWTTSWGSSTRTVGGLIMAHGDDAGLRLPPQVAPVQVVLVAVKDGPGIAEALERLERDLVACGTRVRVDDRTDIGLGRRLTDWELKGVPMRLEVGPRDLAAGVVSLVRRDRRERESVGLDGAAGGGNHGPRHRPARPARGRRGAAGSPHGRRRRCGRRHRRRAQRLRSPPVGGLWARRRAPPQRRRRFGPLRDDRRRRRSGRPRRTRPRGDCRPRVLGGS